MLQLIDIHKKFQITSNKLDDKIALDGVNLTINDNDFITVVGSNGSGKSTLLNAIAGTFKVDSGKILLNEKDITNKREYQRAKYFGRVFQNPLDGSMSNMSIIENFALASRRGTRPSLRWNLSKKDKEKYTQILANLDMDLDKRLTTKMGQLSGGQRQAITLLLATIKKPDILLLDEHTAALDPKSAKVTLELTESIITENKITAIMITHNMQDAIRYGNRLIMMAQGKIVLDVSGEEKKNLKVTDLIDKFQSMGEGIQDSAVL